MEYGLMAKMDIKFSCFPGGCNGNWRFFVLSAFDDCILSYPTRKKGMIENTLFHVVSKQEDSVTILVVELGFVGPGCSLPSNDRMETSYISFAKSGTRLTRSVCPIGLVSPLLDNQGVLEREFWGSTLLSPLAVIGIIPLNRGSINIL